MGPPACQHYGARDRFAPDQTMGSTLPRGQLVVDHEHFASGRVDHRGRSDSDRRADVAARQDATWNRCGDMGGPQDGARVGGQRVHGVVLGGDDDPPIFDQRFAVDLTVQCGRCPGRLSGERSVLAGSTPLPRLSWW